MMLLSLNVSTLTVLLVCIIRESAHAAPSQLGWENFQSRNKRATKYEQSVVENWKLVCEEVCGAGYGGPGCGDQCLYTSHGQTGKLTYYMYHDMCPALCRNELGVQRCSCPVVVPDDGASDKQNRDSLCRAACRARLQLKGCSTCFLESKDATDGNLTTTVEDTTTEEETTAESTTIKTTSTAQPTTKSTTTQATTPDWSQVCESLCRNGEGGSLCNCDIPPFDA